jgi:predicted RNase H-like nuclease
MCTEFVGVDWSSGVWVAVVYCEDGDSPEAFVSEDIFEVCEEYAESASRIVVDVPIGLCGSSGSNDCGCVVDNDGDLSRECDDLGRSVIGPRYRSVFTAPCREAAQLAADGGEHAEVSNVNWSVTGKGLTQQAASICAGIVDVEELLLGAGDSERIVEGHPEVCFRAFNGEALSYKKKSALGVDERLSALETVPEYSDGDWRVVADQLDDTTFDIGLDDVLDAFALALTACAPDEEYRQLPIDPPEDARGLPMQMVYRGETPLI